MNISSRFFRMLNYRSINSSNKIVSHNFCTGAAAYPKSYFDDVVKKNKVVIFMKGDPEAPKCGFSNAVVQIMRMHGVTYDSHDVLKDEGVRQGIKDYSEWPTIPQVYLNGEFVGGCDILIQLHQSGDLIDELKKVDIRSALLDEVKGEKDKD